MPLPPEASWHISPPSNESSARSILCSSLAGSSLPYTHPPEVGHMHAPQMCMHRNCNLPSSMRRRSSQLFLQQHQVTHPHLTISCLSALHLSGSVSVCSRGSSRRLHADLHWTVCSGFEFQFQIGSRLHLLFVPPWYGPVPQPRKS